MNESSEHRRYSPNWISLFVFLAVCLILFLQQAFTQMKDHTPSVQLHTEADVYHVSFLDVGDGDCTLIHSSDGKSLLLDTGTREMFTRLKAYIDKMGVKRLDYLVLSHLHEDHAGSALELLNYIDVGEVWIPALGHSDALAKQLRQLAKEKNVPVKEACSGAKLSLGKASMTVLDDGSNTLGDDNSSLVALFQHGTNRFLFTGDAEKAQEKVLLDLPVLLNANVLKVAHHGSKTSTHVEFLQAVHPDFAVISVSKDNPYHLPDYQTLARLEEQQVQIFLTSENGIVRMDTDGDKIKVFSEK